MPCYTRQLITIESRPVRNIFLSSLYFYFFSGRTNITCSENHLWDAKRRISKAECTNRGISLKKQPVHFTDDFRVRKFHYRRLLGPDGVSRTSCTVTSLFYLSRWIVQTRVRALYHSATWLIGMLISFLIANIKGRPEKVFADRFFSFSKIHDLQYDGFLFVVCDITHKTCEYSSNCLCTERIF